MQQAGLQQNLHQRLDAADADQLRHRIAAARPQVREHGHPRADAREIIELEFDSGGVRDRQQVQHRVGGARQRNRHDDRIFEGLAAQDVGRLDAAAHQVDHGAPGALGVLPLVARDRLLGRAVRQAHAERLDRRGHRVRRVHPAAAARARDRGALHVAQLAVRHGAARVRADGLEDRDDVAPLGARPDRAAIDEDCGPVEPRDRHHAAGHVLVAAAERDQTVETLGADHGLDRVGDHLARHQRVTHARRAHRDAVGDGDRAEDRALAARSLGTLRSRVGETVDVHVAGRQRAPGRRDADLRAAEIAVVVTDRPQHRPARGLLDAVEDDPGMGARIGSGLSTWTSTSILDLGFGIRSGLLAKR